MDEDVAHEYNRTRDLLKDYLVQRRWEGDTTFRGAYLQWSMGWPNATFRPMEVIHNIKHPITGDKRPHVVTKLPSFGEDRLYTKEQELIELVKDRLKNNRPVVIYARQTATKDIQPRLESIIQKHVPEAKTYVLRNTVGAERRERVIEQQIQAGVNVLICNPELVKTGLDLIAFPTLIFYEIVFNLSTLLQAASRSYRLNQEEDECEVIYMFYEGTMEHTAVQLMSRKQRAAKILTGDTGLTGLDALTEGEGGFEAALLNAITGEDDLIDPRDLFKQDLVEDEITAEDNAFWNVDVDEAQTTALDIDFNTYIPEEDDPEAIPVQDAISNPQVTSVPQPQVTADGVVSDEELKHILDSITTESSQSPRSDPLIQFAVEELGGVVCSEPIPSRLNPQVDRQRRYVLQYLETVSYAHQDRLHKYLPRLLTLVREGEWDDKEEVKKVAGILQDCFMDYDPMKQRLLSRITSWLKQKKLITSGHVGDVADHIIDLSLMAFDLKPLQLDIFEGMRIAQKENIARHIPKTASPKQKPKKKRKKKTKLDLLAVPDEPESQGKRREEESCTDESSNTPLQLALFS